MNLAGLQQPVIQGDAEATVRAVEEALAQGIPANEILNEALVPAMTEVGRRMESGDLFIPEVLVAARAMKAAVEKLRPHLIATGVRSKGKVILATVEGDVHDIGKNLVKMMLENANFEVIDLGVNVPFFKIREALLQHQAQIIGLSALLTTTASRMEEIIRDLQKAGLRNQVKVMVGGAAVTQAYATKIGADAYSADCVDAARKASELLALS